MAGEGVRQEAGKGHQQQSADGWDADDGCLPQPWVGVASNVRSVFALTLAAIGEVEYNRGEGGEGGNGGLGQGGFGGMTLGGLAGEFRGV